MAKIQEMETRPLPRAEIVESEELVGQQLFLQDTESGEVHCLNSGAAMIWLLCDGTRSVPAIAREIAETCALPEQQVVADVRETLSGFQELNLLQS